MGVLSVTLDLHGMTVEEAKKALNRKINTLSKDYGQVVVIHGYRTGNRLQTFVRKEYQHPRLKRRLLTLNQGETILVIE
jgi:dsDNA-specific endonuclease/ATPase MutS2